jgi:predicted RNA binding protein YcfA (HicA-like mRNA interferase family)
MIPSDLKGKDLVKKLESFGYEVVRQNGSHIRIQTLKNGKHSETIPNHNPMAKGTLRTILKNVAAHFNISLDDLISRLFANK